MKHLEKRLKYWQKVLRLQDWEISLEEVRMSQMDAPDRFAQIKPDLYHKRAEIRILVPEDAPGHDRETSLVHELVHIHLAPGFDNVPEVVLEQSVDALTRALIALERKNG